MEGMTDVNQWRKVQSKGVPKELTGQMSLQAALLAMASELAVYWPCVCLVKSRWMS